MSVAPALAEEYLQRAREATPEYWIDRAEEADLAAAAEVEQTQADDQEALNRLSIALKAVQLTDHSKLEACRVFVQEAKADAEARAEYQDALRKVRARGIETFDPFARFAVRAAMNTDEALELRKLRESFREFGRL